VFMRRKKKREYKTTKEGKEKPGRKERHLRHMFGLSIQG